MKKYILGILILTLIAAAVFLMVKVRVKKRGVEIELKKGKEIKKLQRNMGKTLEEKVDELKKKSRKTFRKKKDDLEEEAREEIDDITEADREKLEDIIEEAQE